MFVADEVQDKFRRLSDSGRNDEAVDIMVRLHDARAKSDLVYNTRNLVTAMRHGLYISLGDIETAYAEKEAYLRELMEPVL